MKTQTTMLRRKFLVLVSSIGTALSGCQSLEFSDETVSAGPKIELIGVGNWDSEPHTIYIQVHQNNELVLEKEVRLDSYSTQSDADEATLQRELPSTPGRYNISARREDSKERAAEITDEDVCRVDIIVQEDGELGISSRTDCEYQ